MGARRKYPQFDDWTAEEFAGLLRLCKLGPEDKEIATQCIVWRMDMIDVGEAHNMDRSTVSRRLDRVILPELTRMMRRVEMIKAGA